MDDDGDDVTDRRGPDPIVVLGEGVLQLLRRIAGDRGCVVRLEDLHWADADSVALLDYLAGALTSSRIAVVASARDEPAHVAARPLLASPTVDVMALERLDDGQVAALAAAVAGRGPVP